MRGDNGELIAKASFHRGDDLLRSGPLTLVVRPTVSMLAKNLFFAAVAGHPLWWFLGLDQFVYPFLLLLVFTLISVGRGRFYMSRLLVALCVFTAAVLFSSFFIVETERYLTFLKNFSTYVTAVLLLLTVPAIVRTWSDARRMLRALIVAVGVSGVIGVIAIAGIWRPEFTSLVSSVLPDSVTTTALGSNIVDRNLGWIGWFSGLGSYFRVKGLYLWPTSYAPILVMTIPVVVFLARRSRSKLSRHLYGAIAVALSVNLVFTTGRVAVAALAAAAAYWFLADRNQVDRRFKVAVVVGVITLVVTVVALEPTTRDIGEQLQEVVMARGAGSPQARLTIYRTTAQGFLERPFFGWGTERSIPGVSDSFIYPAGSHSYYLGVLYRHGLIGFALFTLVWTEVWRALKARRRGVLTMSQHDRNIEDLLLLGRGIVVAGAIMSLTLAFDLDAALMFVWWLLIATFVAVARFPSSLNEAVGSA